MVNGSGYGVEPRIGKYSDRVRVWGQSSWVRKIFGSCGNVCGSSREAGVIGT